MTQAMKNWCNPMRTPLIIWSLAAASLLASGTAEAHGRPGKKIDVRIEAGETHEIDHLDRSAVARITVIDNPNALVVIGGIPGELTLIGAEAGCWEIAAEQASGEQVTYDITVTSIARPFSNPLAPGRLPYLPDPNCNGFSANSGSTVRSRSKHIEIN
jgi:hypothetical protein